MSDNTNKSGAFVEEIVIPEISDAGYVDSLDKAFDTINMNFAKLANRDFVKGDAGVSVKIVDYKFFNEDGTLTVFGKTFRDSLEKFIKDLAKDQPNKLADIKDNGEKVCGLFDYFDNNKEGSLKMICELDETKADSILPVTSLYYVFKDGRYMGEALSKYETQYDGIEDQSCIFVYDVDRETGEGKLSSLKDAFPTVYYHKGIGLCWRINGKESGLPIRGIPGKDGANATLYIVQLKNIENSTEPGKPTEGDVGGIAIVDGEVNGIYEPNEGYIKPIEAVEDITALDNQAAVILGPIIGEDAIGNTFYFGTLYINEEKILRARCSSDTSITTGLDNEAFINSMKCIDLLNNGTDVSSGIKGLFIPLQSLTEDKPQKVKPQKVHLLTASSITNDEGISGVSNDLKSDVLWTPVADINSLEVNSEKPLEIDKYLYVKVNPHYNSVVQFANSNNLKTGDNPLISSTNYVLKYKLENILSGGSDRNSKYFAEYSPFQPEGEGSRYYGCYYDTTNGIKEKIQDPDTDTVVLTDDKNNPESTDHFASMPKEFISRLESNAGIYRWKLCSEVHTNWDADELLNTITGNIDNATYGFDKRFNVVFTTDLTPGEGTQIMWFDGSSFEKNNTQNKYAVPGWITNKRLQTSDEGEATDYIFKFIKFVPIYNIDSNTQIDTDTALNINYNVNITGDNNNSKRSLSVHGDISCDTINVYKLTATGEIDNIYTRNDILGDAGIKLAKNIDEDTVDEHPYLFNVDSSSGNVTTNGKINAGNDISSDTKVVAPIIECPSVINITEDATGNITSNMYKLLGNTHREELEYDNTKLAATVESDNDTIKMYKDRLKIDLVDTGIIDIKKRDLQLDKSNFEPEWNNLTQNKFPAPERVSKIMTDLPIVSHGKSSIVITDDVPSNAFVADVHTASIHEGFDESFGNKDIKNNPISGQMIDKLFNKPNSYVVNKQIIESKHKSTTISNKVIQTKNSFAIINDLYNISGAQYESIYYSNPSPATTQSFEFRENDSTNETITELFIKPSNDPNIVLNVDKGITISLPKLKFGFGLYSHCYRGKWTILKNASLTLRYNIQSISSTNVISNIAIGEKVGIYSFPDSNKYWSGSTAKYTQKGGSVASDNYEDWRFKAYEFNPKDITIPAKYMNTIADAFNDKETIKITFYPEFDVNVASEGGKKKLADDCMILRLRPIGNSSKSGSIETAQNYVNTISNTDIYSRCVYWEDILGSADDDDFTTNTLCTDGFIVDSKNYVFGLGFGIHGTGQAERLEPELYFGYYNSASKEYNSETISLNDLFAKLRTITL